ncbi:hypothetical protein H2248_005719, partial [Termitomyces sp. 'cryptogamus']
IFTTTICPPPIVAEIWARQTTSQQLAETFVANSQPKPFCSHALDAYAWWYKPTANN